MHQNHAPKSRENDLTSLPVVELARLVPILFAPIRRFYKTIYLIIFRPRLFADQSLHLGDKTNFVRGAKLYLEAVSYSFVLLTVVSFTGGLPTIASEWRMWIFLLSMIGVLTFGFYLFAQFFVPRGVTLKNLLHLEFYLFAAAATVASVYSAAFTVLEFMLGRVGLNLFASVPEDLFSVALNSCLRDNTVLLGLISRTATQPSGSSLTASLLRAGYPVQFLILVPATIIAARKFNLGTWRASAWLLSGYFAGLLIFYGGIFGIGVAEALNANCTEKAYYDIGRKSPSELGQMLEQSLEKDLPIQLSDTIAWTGVEWDDARGLTNHYSVSTRIKTEELESYRSWQLPAYLDLYCSEKFGRSDHLMALRRLGISVSFIHHLDDGATRVIFSISPENCMERNFSAG